MKSSEVFKKLGDAGRNAATGVVARAFQVEDGRVRVTAPGIVAYADSLDGDWQPLLSREEWQAQHPLRLRKLGEGEVLLDGRLYYYVHEDMKESGTTEGYANKKQIPGYTYYELPDLTAAQSEPTTAEAVESLAGEVTPPWSRAVKVEPAPNPVGERLTEPPEAGTWVIRFDDMSDDWGPTIHPWYYGSYCLSNSRYYRWLGPIPEEPKPEKVETPKWLGAVAQRECHANQDWRLVVYVIDEPGDPNKGESYRLRGVSNHNGKPTWDGIYVSDARLITDDPDYPPSPELVSLFETATRL